VERGREVGGRKDEKTGKEGRALKRRGSGRGEGGGRGIGGEEDEGIGESGGVGGLIMKRGRIQMTENPQLLKSS